jgi:DNA-binding NtrC family response regulator
MDDMKAEKYLKGKRILIVDDEEDILETLSELLIGCRLDRATRFEDARALLENRYYDMVVLDIMGVKGHDLLETAVKRGFPTVMLTAHALTEEDLRKSFKRGASYYIPKDQITDIPVFLADVLKAIENEKNPWSKWFDRLGNFFDRKFGGTDWREKEEKFWEKERKKLYGR